LNFPAATAGRRTFYDASGWSGYGHGTVRSAQRWPSSFAVGERGFPQSAASAADRPEEPLQHDGVTGPARGNTCIWDMPRRSAICDCDMFSKNRSVSRGRSRSGTREGDAIVLIGIDRLGGNAAEVMTTIRELAEHGIVLRSLREGIDTSNATGRMWRANWPALRNLSWSWVVSGGQQHARRVGPP
jgi:Resolvase, N terminal domain